MVTVAKTAGFCFGVQRAVDMAEKACQEYGCIWALGDIIHNAHEVGRLEKLGVHKAEDVADIPDGVPVLIRAHGVPERVVQQLEQKGCRIVDATCPFVGKIHRIVREESEQGRRIIVVDDTELDDDLVRDMTEVLTSFCARLYGRRAAKHKTDAALRAARDA